jgi:hypothetical protein
MTDNRYIYQIVQEYNSYVITKFKDGESFSSLVILFTELINLMSKSHFN